MCALGRQDIVNQSLCESRLDLALVERGLVPTRSRARDLIRTGKVRVGAQVCTKAAAEVGAESELTLEDVGAARAVSRGGQKLAAALAAFEFDPAGQIALDVGASTGGFTQVLLDRGAQKVYAADRGGMGSCIRASRRMCASSLSRASTRGG